MTIYRTDDRTFTYRNIHTGDTITIVGAPMMDDALYALTSPWLDGGENSTFRMVFGMEGRDGTTFDPKHWRRAW